ncbi:MAG TPA: hypothetical protein DCS56_07220, partial [Alcanivorax sp.]|nr:hypothetical protein [Alcanivorax sp.]
LAPDELNDNGIYEINNRFIVVRDGAVIDVSGTRADLDLGGDRPTTVASSAGGLAMRSNAGIYFDGELRARAGGEGAAGGDLELMLETVLLPSNSGDERQAGLRNIVLGEQLSSGMPEDIEPGPGNAGLRYGEARLATDDLADWGVDGLSVWARDAILFEGDT